MEVCNELDKWERKLCPQIEEVDLLGHILEQITITPQEVHELGRLIGELVCNLGWVRANEVLHREFPCSFVIYLVLQGIHGYESGDFWSGVRKTTSLNLSSSQTAQWGQLFERIISELGKVHFPSSGGYRYVRSILAHGGIPDYCLPNFFEHFIYPWLTRPEYTGLSASEFIKELLHQPSTQYQVNKPVINFLQYGGKVAEDFVERCREMALHVEEYGVVPSAEEVGLSSQPQVVDKYREWWKGRSQPSVQKIGRYRKPELFLDPWWGPSLHLPSQQIPVSESEVMVVWRVYVGPELEALHEETVEVTQEGPALRTEEKDIPLSAPASEYHIELALYKGQDLEEETLKLYQYPGCPLMIFDPNTQKLISQDILPARSLWILFHRDIELETEPSNTFRVVEEFPQLPGKWNEFVVQEIELSSEAQRLIVRKGDKILSEFLVESEDQPSLEGENLFPAEDGGPPLYIGEPPLVYIPLSSSYRTRLHKWHVRIQNEGAALPDVNISRNLRELEEKGEISFDDRFAVLDLKRYLGSSPMGNYKVRVRGPLGHRADLSFRVLPAEIIGHDILYLPDKSQSKARFQIRTFSQLEVLPQPGTEGCKVTPVEGEALYEVTVEHNRSDAPLQFMLKKQDGETVSVRISVPIRRLRWKLVLSPEQALTSEWRTSPLDLPLEALEQSIEPYLFVDLFGGACDRLMVTLCLEDTEGKLLRKPRFRKGRSSVRFDLRSFLDTMRHTSSHLSLKLALRGLPDTSEEVSFPVLLVKRGFVVEKAEVDAVWEGDKVHLSLRWRSPVRLRHRFVRFWSAWRSWEEEPLKEVDIPDHLQEEYHFSVPTKDLPPGKYLLEFGIRDPWSPRPLKRPSPNDQAVVPVFVLPDVVQYRLGKLNIRRLRKLDIDEWLDNCELLLTVEDDIFEEVRTQVALKLLSRGHISGVNAIMEWLRKGSLSLNSILTLLEYTIQQLLDQDSFGNAQAMAKWIVESIPSIDDKLNILRYLVKCSLQEHPDGIKVIVEWKIALQSDEIFNKVVEYAIIYLLRHKETLPDDVPEFVVTWIKEISSQKTLSLPMPVIEYAIKWLLQQSHPTEWIEVGIFSPDEVSIILRRAVQQLLRKKYPFSIQIIIKWARDRIIAIDRISTFLKYKIPRLFLSKHPIGSEVVQAIVKWVKEGILSDEDALASFRGQIQSAVETLKKALPHPVAVRLLEKLGEEDPDQVPTIPEAVLEQAKKSELSDEDSLALLERNLLSAIKILKQALPNPVAIRLLEKLGKKYPDQVPVVVVRPGYWVRCVAGWGRIERIEGPEGKEVSQFFPIERAYRLYVLLRAQDPKIAEQVTLDLRKRTVTFLNADHVYMCRCGRFSTQHKHLIFEHNRLTHGGMKPNFRQVGVTLKQRVDPEFSFREPVSFLS